MNIHFIYNRIYLLDLYMQSFPSGDLSLLQGGGNGAVHGVLRVVLQPQMPEGGLDDVPPPDLQANSVRAI